MITSSGTWPFPAFGESGFKSFTESVLKARRGVAFIGVKQVQVAIPFNGFTGTDGSGNTIMDYGTGSYAYDYSMGTISNVVVVPAVGSFTEQQVYTRYDGVLSTSYSYYTLSPPAYIQWQNWFVWNGIEFACSGPLTGGNVGINLDIWLPYCTYLRTESGTTQTSNWNGTWNGGPQYFNLVETLSEPVTLGQIESSATSILSQINLEDETVGYTLSDTPIITLSWGPVTNATSYNVYGWSGAYNPSKLASIPASANLYQFVHSGILPYGTPWQYYVTAVVGGVEQPASNTVMVTLPSAPPLMQIVSSTPPTYTPPPPVAQTPVLSGVSGNAVFTFKFGVMDHTSAPKWCQSILTLFLGATGWYSSASLVTAFPGGGAVLTERGTALGSILLGNSTAWWIKSVGYLPGNQTGYPAGLQQKIYEQKFAMSGIGHNGTGIPVDDSSAFPPFPAQYPVDSKVFPYGAEYFSGATASNKMTFDFAALGLGLTMQLFYV